MKMEGSNHCKNYTPSIDEALEVYFRHSWSSILFIFAVVSTCVSMSLFFFTYRKIRQHNPPGSSRRRSLILIFGLFPVFAVTSLCGIIIPRAANIVNWVSNIYLGVAIFSFLDLLTEYFGGFHAMLAFYQKNKVSFAQPPFACCCRCLPEIYMTRRQFQWVRNLVLQVTLVRPTLVLISAILWSDAILPNSVIHDIDTANIILGALSGFSTGLAVYGLLVFNKSGAGYLERFYVKVKFAVIQSVLVTTTILDIVLNILQQFSSINCRGPFSVPGRTLILYNHVIVHLMAVIFILIYFYWVWLSHFSEDRDEADKAPSVPGSSNAHVVTQEDDRNHVNNVV